ncbi:6-carboxytetrahydropterin synthase QueD [bacterium]|nr:6-carboxytetrahydropterin synthase QueD [bacterium]
MYEVNAQVEFSAAHHLLKYEGGQCEQQHGHNWTVEVSVRGDILDKSNILVDFKALKRDLRLILADLDHQDLNELPDFKGESPSSEFIANYIYYKMKEKYVELYKVSVWETRESCATYYEEE